MEKWGGKGQFLQTATKAMSLKRSPRRRLGKDPRKTFKNPLESPGGQLTKEEGGANKKTGGT